MAANLAKRTHKARNIYASVESDTNGYHLTSEWSEPPRPDHLTLYELHRTPRPTRSGRIQRPFQALQSEFKCVICLDYVQNARVVMECLHRFCEDCIEKHLRLSKRKECPICRVAIPSRRSLAPDPKFESLLHAILGPLVNEKEEESSTKMIAGQVPKPSPPMTFKRTPPATVYLWLERYPGECLLDELKLPFLRLSGDATVGVIHKFLQAKLGVDEGTSLEILSILEEDRQVVWDAEVILRNLSKFGDEDGQCHLYYRIARDHDD